jgi:hypothetical protein
MAKQDHLTAERVRELLLYDPETGLFTWRIAVGDRYQAGTPAGSFTHKGYRSIYIGGFNYPAHRLAWLYVTGQWPTKDIDHIDQDKANNRFANLRDVSRSANMQNVKAPHKDNALGVRNVYLCEWNIPRPYCVRFTLDGKCVYQKYVATLEEAAKVAEETRLKLHPYAPHVGKVRS